MTQQYYAYTIDKATTKSDTSKQELHDVTMRLMNQFHLHHNKYFRVEAYELKKPTKRFPKGRLHYHALLHSFSYNYHNRLNYIDVKCKGYSIKVRLLSKPQDIAEWAGYVQKDKIDFCDIVYKKPQTFKKDVKKMTVLIVPSILDFYNKK